MRYELKLVVYYLDDNLNVRRLEEVLTRDKVEDAIKDAETIVRSLRNKGLKITLQSKVGRWIS